MHRLGNHLFDTAYQYEEINLMKEHQEEYYPTYLECETKGKVNPFRLRKFLNEKCKQLVEEQKNR